MTKGERYYHLNVQGRTMAAIAEKEGIKTSQVAFLIQKHRKENKITKTTPQIRKEMGILTPDQKKYYDSKKSDKPRKSVSEPKEPPIIGEGVQMADLSRKQCHFPYGDKDFTFCGEPVKDGSSYCQVHHDFCYEKTPPIDLRVPREGRDR